MRDYHCYLRFTGCGNRFEYLAPDHEEVRCPKCGALAKSVLSPVHLKDVG